MVMVNKVIKRNRIKQNTPHLKGTLTIELNQCNTCFIFEQIIYFATLWKGPILLVHSTFFYQSVDIMWSALHSAILEGINEVNHASLLCIIDDIMKR